MQQIYQGAAEIQKVTCPLLVVHGEKDDVVPIEQGREIFAAAATPVSNKRFLLVPAVRHNNLPFTKPPASDAVAAFLAGVGSPR